MGRHHLEVLHRPLAILGARIRCARPGSARGRQSPADPGWPPIRHLGGVAIGVLFVPAALAFQVVEEPLIVPLQLVVQHDPVDDGARLPEALDGPRVGAIELGIVGQFSRLHEAGVVRLRGALAVGPAMPLQQRRGRGPSG